MLGVDIELIRKGKIERRDILDGIKGKPKTVSRCVKYNQWFYLGS